MDQATPLLLRCLALTGTFETSKLPPGCFGSVAGDFDGQGLSYSALQWNLGQGTLQPLMAAMFANHSDLMGSCFGDLAHALQAMLALPKPQQLSWARSTVNDLHHRVPQPWADAFARLGATSEWQSVAMTSAAKYFDQAKYQASIFKMNSDRAIALLFDISVQNGGVSNLAMRHLNDEIAHADPKLDKAGVMLAVAHAVADSCNPLFRVDVLARKLCVATGNGVVHGAHYDLAKQFSL